MKLLTGIVLFNPDLNLLKKNMTNLVEQTNNVVLVDNSSSNIKEIEKLVDNFSSIKLIKNYDNEGIARALNQIMHYGDFKGAEWCLLLDQDSEIDENYINNFLEVEVNENESIITPQVIDADSGFFYDESNNMIEYVTKCITSGSINRLSSWKKVEGFDEQLFIDGVDHDYCKRIIDEGYKIRKDKTLKIVHKIGEAQEKKIFGTSFLVFHHTPFRKYYIVRNIIYLNTKNNVTLKTTILQVLKQYFVVIMYEKDKFAKLVKMNKGVRDGIRMSRQQRK